MKKPLIDIKKINNNDVIATSGSGLVCGVNLEEYTTLFQSDGTQTEIGASGNYTGFAKGLKNGIYYTYDSVSGQFKGHSASTLGVYNFAIGSTDCGALEDGKWYHVNRSMSYGTPDSVIECTDPNHHGAGAN